MADKLVVVGQGYVGLPLAMRAVEAGFDVVGFDTDAERVKRLAAADSYVEDIPSAKLAAALATGRYDLELVVDHASYVLDTRHRLTGAQVEHL